MADPLIGLKVGDYNVTARLAHSEVSPMYRVRHRALKIDRALQVIEPYAEEAHRHVLGEAQILQAIRHKNLVRIHDSGEVDGVYYLLTEFLNGGPLSALIERDGPMNVRDALKTIRDVTSGLVDAHNKSVVHRNVRPGSIFIAREGGVNVPKLVDFGLGLPYSFEGVKMLCDSDSYPGEARHAAPEQLGGLSAGEVVDSRADVYALGLCLYQALTGEQPFTEASPAAARNERLRQPPPPPSAVVGEAGIEAELDDLVMQMIAVERPKRPADARAVTDELDRLLLGVRRRGARPVAAPRASQPVAAQRGPRPAAPRRTPTPRVELPPPPVEPAAAATSPQPSAATEPAPQPESVSPKVQSETSKVAEPAKPVKTESEPGWERPLARDVDPEQARAVLERQINFSGPSLSTARSSNRPLMWAVIAMFAFVLALLALLPRDPSGAESAAKVAPAPRIDRLRLNEAVSSGDIAEVRAWLRSYPRSPLRADAYLALRDLGAPAAEVCRIARNDSESLVEASGALASLCSFY